MFYALPDGGIGGGWPEPVVPTDGGAPVFPEPEAGIPRCDPPWTRLTDGTCEPVFPARCADDQEYPDLGELPQGAVVLHVLAGATTSAPTGSQEAPFPTITQALQGSADTERWVRIAAGAYREDLAPRGRVHLVGCRQRVTIQGVAENAATVHVSLSSAEVELRGLTIRATGYGLAVALGARAMVRDVAFTSHDVAGVIVSGAGSRAELSDAELRGAGPLHLGSRGGAGLLAQAGGVLVARRTLVVGSREFGAGARGVSTSGSPSRVELSDCVVRDTAPRPGDLHAGHGLRAVFGGVAVAARTLLLGNHEAGVLASSVGPSGEPSRVELTDCVVRGTLGRQSDQIAGHGIEAYLGGVVVAARTRLQGNRDSAVLSSSGYPGGARSRVDLEHCVIQDTLPRQLDLRAGFGIGALLGGLVHARHTHLVRNRETGVIANAVGADGVPSRAVLEDCVVLDTLAEEAGLQASHGLFAQSGGEVLATRTALVTHAGFGVGAAATSDAGLPSRADLTSCVVWDTSPRRISRTLGIALAATHGGLVVGRYLLLERSAEAAIMASGVGTAMELQDILVREVSPGTARGGFGVAMAGGSRATLQRVALVQTRGAGLAAVSNNGLLGSPAGSSITVEDAFIEGIGTSTIDYDAMDTFSVTGPPRSYGAYVGLASSMDLRRVVLLGGDTAVAAFGGAFTWRDGVADRFRRYVARGSSVVTPAPQLQNVVAPGLGPLPVVGDPSPAASFAVPDLGPVSTPSP
ncbi:MAG: DUF1565 domain-containing protein [Deltaproteobacteria bacterium]|nr:DUF1565 domain-containing protein [Deltaproteobacteria bacterium]